MVFNNTLFGVFRMKNIQQLRIANDTKTCTLVLRSYANRTAKSIKMFTISSLLKKISIYFSSKRRENEKMLIVILRKKPASHFRFFILRQMHRCAKWIDQGKYWEGEKILNFHYYNRFLLFTIFLFTQSDERTRLNDRLSILSIPLSIFIAQTYSAALRMHFET